MTKDPKKTSVLFSFLLSLPLPLPFFLFLLVVFYIPSPEFDFWWHLKTGEVIWRLKTVPHADIFSFGKTGRWVHHEWFSDVIFFLVYYFFSLKGLLVFRAVVLAAACIFVFKMCVEETQNKLLSLCVTFLCALSLVPWKPGGGMRPHFFTLFFTALTQELLFYKKKTTWLPFVFFVWANLHGGYVSGFILLSAFCVSEGLSKDRRRFLSGVKLFALCFLAGLLTPNHAYEFIYPFQILLRRDLYRYNYEWFPPDIHKIYTLPFFTAASLFFLFSLKRFFKKDIFHEGEVFFLFPYLAMSALSLRNIPLFAVVSAPFLVRHVREVFQHAASLLFLVVFFLCVIFLSVMYENTVLPRQRALSPSVMAEQVPQKAVEFIKDNHIPGRLFPEPDWGGYAIFKLYPEYKVGVDTRFDTVYDKDYLVRVIKAFSGGQGWEKVFNETKTNLILLDAIATPLKEELYASGDYTLIYYDGQSVLFIKNQAANQIFIKKFYTKELKARQRSYYDYRHGIFALNANRFEKAQSLFLEGVSFSPRDPKLHYLLGVTFSKQKKYDAAYWSLKAAAAISPENTDYLYSFGYVCAMLGKRQEAEDTLKKLLLVSPSDDNAKKLLKGIDMLEKENQKSP